MLLAPFDHNYYYIKGVETIRHSIENSTTDVYMHDAIPVPYQPHEKITSLGYVRKRGWAKPYI
jgi:hypothetical protein